MIKKIIFISVFLALANGCTRDDICSEATPATPKLVLRFHSITNPLVLEEVVGLSVETDEENPRIVLAETSTDSIALPLQTAMDTTKFRFIKRINDSTVNIDKIMFVAQRNEIYVNRACGYKTNYENLSTGIENEGAENWLHGFEIINTTVENENEAHLIIYH